MQYPADLQVLSGAAAVGAASFNAITAPILPAGRRYRVWQFSSACFNVFAAATIRVGLVNAAGSTFAAISYHSTTASVVHPIPGGLVIPELDSPRINVLANVATANLWLCSLMFTIEAV